MFGMGNKLFAIPWSAFQDAIFQEDLRLFLMSIKKC